MRVGLCEGGVVKMGLYEGGSCMKMGCVRIV